MPEAFLGIGGNLGNREQTLRRTVRALEGGTRVTVLAASRVYETDPVSDEDQPAFLNGVLKVETALTARELLNLLLEVEQHFGRVRERKWGPRTLDLDILTYEAEVIREKGLDVPHPYLHERGFVLIPLCDLAADTLHPSLGRTFKDLADEVGDRGVRVVPGLQLLPGIGEDG